ncbi:hypothetical protein GGR45_002662 [Sphingomonas zeae]|jgi:hypothetical protein|nr:hypothetical protein [Sphingomonas zeae]
MMVSAPPSQTQVAPAPATSASSKAAHMQAAEAATLVLRQVRPCVQQVVNPGPGAERIRVTLRLHYNRDGMLAATPVILGHSGVDAGNAAYVARLNDQLTTVFRNRPLRDMPPALYGAPGGWSDFTLRFRLPG